MPRVTASEVQEILDTSLDTTSLDAHIEAASLEVDDIEDTDPSLASDRLAAIEKYLAAHIATAQDQRASSQSGESRSVSYSEEMSSSFLETATRLDPTGTVGSGGKPAASFDVPDVKKPDRNRR